MNTQRLLNSSHTIQCSTSKDMRPRALTHAHTHTHAHTCKPFNDPAIERVFSTKFIVDKKNKHFYWNIVAVCRRRRRHRHR